MLGTNCRVIQSGRDRMRQLDIPVLVLQHEGAGALEYASAAAGEAGGVTAAGNLLASCFDADEPHIAILDERIEDTHRVAAAADAGDDCGWQTAGELQYLGARFLADDRLKLADHERIRV